MAYPALRAAPLVGVATEEQRLSGRIDAVGVVVTTADSQPTLPGFHATSGIAGESLLLPPLTGAAAKDPETPLEYSANGHEGPRNAGSGFAGESRPASEKPQRDRSLSSGETTADGFCECGCGEHTPPSLTTDKRWGRVAGEPLRFLRGHQHRKAVAPACGYTVDGESGCWEWQLWLDRAGYGRMNRDGRKHHAHRYFYEQAKGPIPEGLHLDHLCRNPRCVNPEHLEAVTLTENNRRSRATKLSVEAVRAIRASDEPLAVLAARHGVDKSNIVHIRAGRSWVGV